MKARTIGLGTVLAMAVMMAGCEKKAAPASAPALVPKGTSPNSHVLVRRGGLLPKEGMKFVTEVIQVSKGTIQAIHGQETISNQPFEEKSNRLESLESLTPSRARYLLETIEVEKTADGHPVVVLPDHHHQLKGVPLLVDKSSGFLSVSSEFRSGKTADIKDLFKLEERLNRDSSFAIYGSGAARQPGDRWEVRTLDMHEFHGLTDLRGSFVVEFVEIKELHDTPCAVLKFTFDLQGTTTGVPLWVDEKIILQGESTCYRSLADRIDLDVNTEGKKTVEGWFARPRDGVGLRAMEESTFTYRQKTRIEKR